MEYLKVKNWSKFQHYKTRNPPWIKLYRSITTDYAFCQLSDVDKCHLIMLWIEAAANDGTLPFDASYLRRRLSLRTNPDLNLFINNGWLIKTLAPIASTEKRREEKRREEGQKPVDNFQNQQPENTGQKRRIRQGLEFLYKRPDER